MHTGRFDRCAQAGLPPFPENGGVSAGLTRDESLGAIDRLSHAERVGVSR
jgi:hypothetical protein